MLLKHSSKMHLCFALFYLYVEEIFTFPSCAFPTYFVGETVKKLCENVRKRFLKTRKNIKMSNIFGGTSQVATEAGVIKSDQALR